MNREPRLENRNWLSSHRNILLLAFLGILGFLVVTDYREHVFGLFPYLLLLACPFIHFIMHRGHGGRNKH